MKLKITFLLLFSFQVVFAQFGPENIISTCDICTPEDSYSADIDGDGDNDILVASSVDDKISWLENLGNGLFSEPFVVSTDVPDASAVLAADFDGDGDLDIAVSAVGIRRIGILYNDGMGHFSEPDYMSYLSLGVESFVAGDIDNDGDIDIVCAEDYQSTASWYKNLGNGNFAKYSIDQVSTIIAVQVADIDGDNDLDVLVSSNEDVRIAWYENDGNGDFSEPNAVTELGVNTFSVSIGDLDNDGDLDVLGKGFFADRLAWYPNDGTGNFGEGVDVSSYQDRGLSTSIADIDDDGDLDIVSASSYFGGQILYYSNDGTGGFPDQVSIGSEIPGVESILTIDIDQDGILDIVSAAKRYDQITWFENQGDFSFQAHVVHHNPNHSISKIVGIDIDNDEFQDFVLSGADDNIYWYQNSGDGEFVRQNNVAIPDNSNSYDVARINQDVYPDLFVVKDDGISWMENDGAGNFSGEISIYNGITDISRRAIVAELNGDSNKDILTCSQYLNTIAWHQNVGGGSFSDPTIISTTLEEPKQLLTLDINNNGYQDIIVATDDGFLVRFENMGNGMFSEFTIIDSLLDYSISMNGADLDNDNNQDLIVVSDEYVLWYENVGDGTFSERKTIYEHTHNLYARSVFGIDLDGDGDKEVVTGAYSGISESDYSTGIVFWDNLGDGMFSGKRNIGEAIHFNYVYPSDLNNDGDFDILVSSRDNDRISWYENLSNYPNISGIAFYDENGNGIVDASEQALQNTTINLIPNALSTYTDIDGSFRFYVSNGTYVLSASPDSCWVLTSDSSSYTINIDNSSALDLNFGYDLSFQNPHVQPRLYSGFTRCGFEVGFNLNVENDGCTIANGMFGLIQHELVTYIDASIVPDFINGDTLWWNYSNLLPTEFASIYITFEIAGVNFIGEEINMEVLSLIEDEDAVLISSGTYDYQSVIQCAYDPNDKNVYPNRLEQYEENYTLFGEFLEYTIRFQNTGTDTAFTVVIRDTLDANLDLATFRPITASHTFETFLYENGLVEFHFKDILLPDSTTNEISSHGFVSYKIKPKPDLEEQTEIHNSAGIYFDFNPPIITNVVKNVLVSEFPIIDNLSYERKESFFLVYPNPTTGIVNVLSGLTENHEVIFSTLSGQLIRSYNLSGTGKITFDVDSLPSGVYLVYVRGGNVYGGQKIVIIK